MLGGTKKQAVLAVLHCALAITVLGAAAGGILGCGVTILAGTGIMEENLEELETDMTGAYDMSGFAEQEADIRIQADLLATWGPGGATLLYPLFLLGFAALDINKEPRELLPREKARGCWIEDVFLYLAYGNEEESRLPACGGFYHVPDDRIYAFLPWPH